MAEAGQRFAYGGRVVAEIVDYRDAVDLAADFLPSFDAFECAQCFLNLADRQHHKNGPRKRPWPHCGC